MSNYFITLLGQMDVLVLDAMSSSRLYLHGANNNKVYYLSLRLRKQVLLICELNQ